ncbi:restriction endonuclease [Sphingobacterium sp. SGG-5]|uniref:ATP cone domain-containing protein n=1 Tax=Sphingobacterium sp. SGG-5 TaxID=2710881 RepID=UPI0013EAD629|nr:ATP cone domain-containing protein [Sphingobacterium sp. SGG-5]NGM61914.1 restriction endonuclease [Sphingobacterium sp. SGG-5]
MQVKKYSGELVPFNPDSLRHSLSRSGANAKEVNTVFTQIQHKLYNGISTRELYELAFRLLKEHRNVYAARYSLKKALRDLGPEGFYFERWVAKLFQTNGYEAITGQTIQGHAVTHEIDVVAMNEKELLAIECKFRNDIDAKISVTTPMYFMSRVKDISDITYTFFHKTRKITAGWLVTNAYFTSDSIKFGEYHKMNLLSWDYPKENSLKLRVDDNGEYPITCLTSLSTSEKAQLLKQQCILVKDIVRFPKFLQDLPISDPKRRKILLEAQELIDSPLEHA